MYLIDKYNILLEFDLEPGVYIFDPESATGKTYLCKLLKKYQIYGEPVLGYTYNDFELGIDLADLVLKKSFKVIMLDRFDMYSGSFSDLISSLANHTIVLIDCKGEINIDSDFDNCSIVLKQGKIEVY